MKRLKTILNWDIYTKKNSKVLELKLRLKPFKYGR